MNSFEAVVRHHATDAPDAPMVSDWLLIDQDRITTFGHNTDDPDRLHIDPAYAAKFSPYEGKTIAFGFLTISLLTHLYRQSLKGSLRGYALNYGFDRLRLPQVVTVGSRIRGVFRFIGAEDRGGGKTLMRYDTRIEVEGRDKPALVAEWLAMWVDDGVARPEGGQAGGAA